MSSIVHYKNETVKLSLKSFWLTLPCSALHILNMGQLRDNETNVLMKRLSIFIKREYFLTAHRLPIGKCRETTQCKPAHPKIAL